MGKPSSQPCDGQNGGGQRNDLDPLAKVQGSRSEELADGVNLNHNDLQRGNREDDSEEHFVLPQ